VPGLALNSCGHTATQDPLNGRATLERLKAIPNNYEVGGIYSFYIAQGVDFGDKMRKWGSALESKPCERDMGGCMVGVSFCVGWQNKRISTQKYKLQKRFVTRDARSDVTKARRRWASARPAALSL